jgi:hypothetical protein
MAHTAKAKAPFKRGTVLIVTGDANIKGGKPTEVKYVRWWGAERAALIVVKYSIGACIHETTTHVSFVKEKK